MSWSCGRQLQVEGRRLHRCFCLYPRLLRKTHYETLGIQKNATESEIRAAYLDLSKKLHPDKNMGNTEAHEKFVQLNKAYGVLNDATTRSFYDVSLTGRLQPGPGPRHSHPDPSMRRPDMSYYNSSWHQFDEEMKRSSKTYGHHQGHSAHDSQSNQKEGKRQSFKSSFNPKELPPVFQVLYSFSSIVTAISFIVIGMSYYFAMTNSDVIRRRNQRILKKLQDQENKRYERWSDSKD